VTEPQLWADDLLRRKDDATLLYKFLTARYAERAYSGSVGAYVLNIDAEWGRGKTFFLTRFAQQVRADNHLAAYVNAWRDDSGLDPLISVMVAIDDALKPLLADSAAAKDLWSDAKQASGQIALSIVKGVLKTAAKKVVGDEIDSIVAALGIERDKNDDKSFGEDAAEEAVNAASEETGKRARALLAQEMQAYRASVEATKQFKQFTSETLNILEKNRSIALPLFVFVDELDRCRPTYSVELLERVKHIFDISGIVFVFGSNISELTHAIGAIYGSSFNSRSYLNRFFDRHYIFEDPGLDDYCKYLFSLHPDLENKFSCPPDMPPAILLSSGLRAFNLQLRDAEQCFDKIRSAASLWDRRVPILFPLFLAQLLVFHTGDINFFNMLKRRGGVDWSATLKAPWSIMIGHRDPATINIAHFVDHIRETIQKPLNKIAEESYPSDPPYAWLRQNMMQEFSILHNNSYSHANPPHSIALSYSSLIGGVGRLTTLVK
jgi:KAP family P-loop domain